jgi:hypothetical protein
MKDKSKYIIHKGPEYESSVVVHLIGKITWNPGIVYAPYVPLIETKPLKRTIKKFEVWLKNKRTHYLSSAEALEIIHVQSMEMMNKLYGEIDKNIPWKPLPFPD